MQLFTVEQWDEPTGQRLAGLSNITREKMEAHRNKWIEHMLEDGRVLRKIGRGEYTAEKRGQTISYTITEVVT